MGWEREEGQPSLLSWQHRQPNWAVNTTVCEAFSKLKPQTDRIRVSRAQHVGITPEEPAPIMAGQCPVVQGHLPGTGMGGSFQISQLPLEQIEESPTGRGPAPTERDLVGMDVVCTAGTGGPGGAEEGSPIRWVQRVAQFCPHTSHEAPGACPKDQEPGEV